MTKAIALTAQILPVTIARKADIARSAIVLASAAALILAGQPLPL